MNSKRRGLSLLEILIVLAVIIVLVFIVGQMMTGTGGQPGVKQRTERRIQQINLYTVYQGFAVYGNSQGGDYPSTRTVSTMQSDTTHQVFKALLEAGVLDGRQLVSANEMDFDITPGSAQSFSPRNTSFALPDYDADNWLRYRHWNVSGDSRFVILSDRWWVNQVHQDINTINETFWHVLTNDGSTRIVEQPHRPGAPDDHLFQRDAQHGALDALMVHD